MQRTLGGKSRALFQHQDNLTVRTATATRIDWEAHHLVLAEGEPLPFDYLVLAAGATARYVGIPGAAENTFPLYSLPDALRVRTQILACFEAAERQPVPLDEGLLTFVIVGGGPTGIETAGALADLFLHVLPRDYPNLAVNKARGVLVERGRLLLPFMKACYAPTPAVCSKSTR
jgi:NADH dehydrogenase